MSYPDSVRFLYSLGNELKVGAKFGLERMQTLLAALGNPERGQRFIHVAGTNGKGSTSAAIAAVLQQHGKRTGLYTSPHLAEPTERIQINGIAVTNEQFADAFQQVHAAAEPLIESGAIDAHPSYFETVTAMAFLLFQSTCDISVIEVGLGGRLDATNVIMPELTVVTPVSFDHEAYLGNTLEAIAGEKAGILKPRVPSVLAPQSPVAERVLLAKAASVASPVTKVSDHDLSDIVLAREHCALRLDSVPYQFGLAGRHQIENAATAILTCQLLGVPTETIQQALPRVAWPGRLEKVSSSPDFLLDGAHNPAGAAALASYIRTECAGHPIWIVFGAMRDKALDEVASELFPLADRLILTAPAMPRALRPEALAELSEARETVITQNLTEAISIARTAPPEAIVFFTGSLFVVGEARQALK